jgi:hypothetical protein
MNSSISHTCCLPTLPPTAPQSIQYSLVVVGCPALAAPALALHAVKLERLRHRGLLRRRLCHVSHPERGGVSEGVLVVAFSASACGTWRIRSSRGPIDGAKGCEDMMGVKSSQVKRQIQSNVKQVKGKS